MNATIRTAKHGPRTFEWRPFNQAMGTWWHLLEVKGAASIKTHDQHVHEWADRLRGWVTVSTPGAGHQREGVISFDLREFAAWYGKGS